jgi:hypothetical protein
MYAMEGVVGRVQRNEEGADAVLRFVVTCDDGTVRAVELRGREIRGVLDDGDRVAFPVSVASGDGLQRPGLMRNLTTASAVTAWRPPDGGRSAARSCRCWRPPWCRRL